MTNTVIRPLSDNHKVLCTHF